MKANYLLYTFDQLGKTQKKNDFLLLDSKIGNSKCNIYNAITF